MDWFKTVKGYYDAGYYTVEQVKVFVVKSKITTADYETITGQVYVV